MKPNGLRLVLHSVPAAQGWRWIALGWQVFRRAPMPLSGLFAGYLFLASLLSLLGLAGALLSLMAVPFVGLAFMLSTHRVLQNKPFEWQALLQPLKLTRSRAQAQLKLGVIYAVALVAVLTLGDQVDGGQLDALHKTLSEAGSDDAGRAAAEKALTDALGNPDFWGGVALRTLGVLLISIPFWHAPALVHWGGQGALQALFSSTLGLWRNRAAFFVNGLGWAAWLFGLSSVLSLVLGVLGLGGLVPLMAMPLGLFLATVFNASLYFMFVDSFRFVAADTPAASDGSAPAEPPPPELPT
ncbi:BPSS1780 family membrane protein [Inhella gelatinilytica]|uniref:DUF2189 domain-containing protein n=1 Tax=Inhella gelatinilytica TaxID=2795030 RepID=A0A931NEX7_9BURK|nr:BPSS1780 family membrane protein [Inhella gelatinilytica]MBH9554164.1 hypothetical protein [Inhella gelatinilytica]